MIGNAIKYTAAGHVRVSHSLEPDALVVKVEDSGRGIPEEKLDRIFDEYYQVDPQGTKRLGVGLGLAIVREVSRLLGFSVAVSSKLGEGTRVRVRIGRQKLLATPQSRAPVADSGPQSDQAGSRCRIVLLEDDDAVRVATELFLTLEGFETKSAASIAEAEALLAGMQPGDILITDYHLEGRLTGLDVLQQVRLRQQRDVPAILLSGDLQSMLRVVKTKIPRCKFLSKPVDTKALLSAIAELGPV